jgi:WD40 repeat protein
VPAKDERPQVFDAFVSYSRVDKTLASRLAQALEAYTPPKDLAVPQRHLRIFRDEDDFTGVEYYASVERHLTSAGTLIVVCSPHARRSQYVNDEIRRFGAAHGADRIVPVLGGGRPNNEASAEDERAFPDALCELMTMPLAVNYTGFDPARDKVNRGAFEGAWYTLLANLFGISRSELEQRDKRRQARVRRFRLAVAGAFVAAILVGLVVSLYQWRQAVIARDTAFSRELAAHAMSQVDMDPDLGVKLALEAFRVSRTGEAEAALREAMAAHRVLTVMPGTKPVRSTALTADGRLLVTGGNDGILRVWQLATGELGAELPGHKELIDATAVTADGRLAASASWDGTARVWDVPGRRMLHELAHGKPSVTSIEFSPDARFVATGAGDGSVRIWNAADGALVRKIDAHSWGRTVVSGVTRVTYSPDGTRLLSSAGHVSTATGEPVARMWDAASGDLVREFSVGAGVVVTSAFSADGSRVLVAGNRGGSGMWDAATGERLKTLDGHTGIVYVAAFSPDGTAALTADRVAGRTGSVVLAGMSGDAPRATWFAVVTSAAFDPAGARVATGSERATRVLDARSGDLLHELRGHGGDVTTVRFGRDGATLVTAGEEGELRVWDLTALPELVLSGLGDAAVGPQFSPDGRWIVAEGSTSAVVWDAARGTKIAELPKVGHMAAVNARAAFDGQGRLMLGDQRVKSPEAHEVRTASGQPAFPSVRLPEFAWFRSRDEHLALIPQTDHSAVVRDRGTWEQVAVLKGHQGMVKGAVFGQDARWVLTASEDSTARVWDVKTGGQLHELRLDNRGSAAGLSPDGRLAYVVADWSTITLWDTTTWQRVHTFTWPAPQSGGNWATVAEFSPDGTLLVVGDSGGGLHFLDVASRTERATAAAHKYKVSTLSFSADGRFVVTTGDGDRGARVWSPATGTKLAEVGTQFVAGATFRPDGRQIATLGKDGAVRLYNLARFAPVEELAQDARRRVKRDWTPGERERYLHEPPKR